MGMLEKVEITRRICPVIFLLDTSQSMQNAPIGAVNAALEGVLPELISMNNDNPDVEIAIAIMKFATTVEWTTGDGLVNPENYAWNDLNVLGATSMGAAFKELNKVLSVSHGFMNRASGSVAPIIFLLTDGEPTDDYIVGLKELQENNWYKIAGKVAIGYGQQSNDEVLREFTGNPETVLHTNDPKDLKNMIQIITITSTMVASTGKTSHSQDDPSLDPDDTTNSIAAELKKDIPVLIVDPDDVF